MSKGMTKLACLATLACTIGACSSRRVDMSASDCSPADGSLAANASADGLSGDFRVVLVSTKGARAGEQVAGRLSLHQHDAELRQMKRASGEVDPDVEAPLYGTADVAFETVGALKLGDTMSMDPMKPGVIVLESHGGSTTITLRIGSLANQRDLVRFDGGYTALHVREVSDDSFAGNWASGVTGAESEGYFCAVRVD